MRKILFFFIAFVYFEKNTEIRCQLLLKIFVKSVIHTPNKLPLYLPVNNLFGYFRNNLTRVWKEKCNLLQMSHQVKFVFSSGTRKNDE